MGLGVFDAFFLTFDARGVAIEIVGRIVTDVLFAGISSSSVDDDVSLQNKINYVVNRDIIYP